MSNKNLNPKSLPAVAGHSLSDSEPRNPDWKTDSSTPRKVNQPTRQLQQQIRELIRDVPSEDWDEDFTEQKPLLLLNANSYKPEVLFDIPVSQRSSRKYVVSPNGNFSYRNVSLPQFTLLKHFGDSGFTTWNGDIVLPSLIDMRRRWHDGRTFPKKTSEYRRSAEGAVWMSITTSEILTQRSGVQKAKGKVLVGGLGLGWFLRKVCEKDTVDEVVVVEKSQELLGWYGYDLCRRHPKVKDVICSDVYDVVGRFPEHQLLLDIWPVFKGDRGAEGDPRLKALRDVAHDRVWAWGMD